MARKSRKGLDTAVQPTTPQKTVYHAGVYVRLSVQDNQKKGDSIETQQAIIREFINQQDDMELREIYIDNGLTGQHFERPSFLRMKDDIENGIINCCITKDLSRLGRNAIDTGFYIESYFPKHGVRYIAVTDGYDSNDGRSGGIMVSLKNMVNETIALETGRKIRAYHQMLDREGGFSGAHPPYGYLNAQGDYHRLIPDEYASDIVRRIFEMYLYGVGATAIKDMLNAEGVLPPKRYFSTIGFGGEKISQGTAYWSAKMVRNILSNRVYCGDIVRGRTKTTNYVKEKKAQSDWAVTEDKHEALISREMFDKAQEIKSGNTANGSRHAAPAVDNIFRGKLICGHCGRSMERTRPAEHIYRYRCCTRYALAKTACVPVSIIESELKEKLLDMLRFVNFDMKRIQAVEGSELDKSELAEIQSERRKNQRLLDGLYESLIAKDITDVEYKEMKTTFTTKIAELVEREKLLRHTEQERIKASNMLTKASDSLNAAKAGYALTADIVDGIIEKISIFEDRSLMVKFTFMDVEIPSREVDLYA